MHSLSATREYQEIDGYLHDYRGRTFKPRIADDAARYLYEQKLGYASRNRTKFSPEVIGIYVTEPSTSELLEIGGSLPSDLFLNNFGTWFAALMQQPVTGIDVVTLTNTAAGSDTNVGIYNATGGRQTFGSATSGGGNMGSQIQLGSSSTAPTRADHVVNTPLATAPENALFGTGPGSYGAGTITCSGSVTSGGTGTINEAGFHFSWWNSTTIVSYMVCHDLTTSTPFVASKSITCQYSFTF